jgi:hypothetical protein
MNYLIAITLIILLNSCSNQEIKNVDCRNLTGLDNELYDKVKLYQKNNPIPEPVVYDTNLPPPPQTAFKYIYAIEFERNTDTLVFITLKNHGVPAQAKNIFGVYQDSCLKPTYVFDANNLSLHLIRVKKQESFNIYQFDKSSTPDILYTRYLYKFRNNKLIFIEKIKGNIGQ